MNSFRFLISILALSFCITAEAQHWEAMGTGISFQPYGFYSDTVDNTLYVTGLITHAGGVLVQGLARWNGSAWDSMGANPSYTRIISEPIRYNGELYAFGDFFSSGNCYFSHWNGTDWEQVNSLGNGSA